MSDSIHNLLNRGTVEVIVKEDLERKLRGKKKLRVKLGIDPSGADLHIGHMVVVRKLKEFQDLGHRIILLFGNFTGRIGDPTGKLETRAPKTQAELEANANHYVSQVSGLLDMKKVEVVWNADWLSKLTFEEVIKLCSQFTVPQMLQRDMFQERLKKGHDLHLHELLYPLMQGYDSVAIRADVELGGTDQTFNLLAGRTIQCAYGQEPQNILTVPILEGLDGHVKMGKSENNYIGVKDGPSDMYGKTMSIPDALIVRYFELATDVSVDELDEIRRNLKAGSNPRDLKMRLARELVTLYHGPKQAKEAESQFVEVFQKKSLPDDIPEKRFKEKKLGILDLLHRSGLASSKSDARRLIEGGGVRLDSERVSDLELVIPLSSNKGNKGKGVLIQVGKRRFLRVKAL